MIRSTGPIIALYRQRRTFFARVVFLAATASAAMLQASDTEQLTSQPSMRSASALSHVPTPAGDSERSIEVVTIHARTPNPQEPDRAPVLCTVPTVVDTPSETKESENKDPADISLKRLNADCYSARSASSALLSPEGQPAQDNAQQTDTD